MASYIVDIVSFMPHYISTLIELKLECFASYYVRVFVM